MYEKHNKKANEIITKKLKGGNGYRGERGVAYTMQQPSLGEFRLVLYLFYIYLPPRMECYNANSYNYLCC